MTELSTFHADIKAILEHARSKIPQVIR